MCYTGKCKYEDFMGNCTVTDNNYHCNEETPEPSKELSEINEAVSEAIKKFSEDIKKSKEKI